MSKPLLDQIEAEAMDGDVVKALRLCIKLGGHSDSADLREWAERELNGYDSVDELPSYRRVNAPLHINGAVTRGRPIRRRVQIDELPVAVQEEASEGLPLAKPISEVRDLALSPQPFSPEPIWGAEAVKEMKTRGRFNLYWAVPLETLKGVVDRVRTDLIRLVNEMRSGMDNNQDFPSSATAAQAVNVVINVDNNRLALRDIRQTAQSSTAEKSRKRKMLEMAYWVAGAALAVVAIVTLVLRFA